MPSLFGLFGGGDRRPQAGRRIAPRPASAAPRRFDASRFESSRYGRGGADARPPQQPRHTLSWGRLAAMALTGCTTLAVIGAGAWLFTGDTFRVRDIEVTGLQIADAQAVVRASGLSGASLFRLDATQAAAGIAALPAVKSARVARVWPHGVRLELVEEQGWGYWQSGSERLVIDADGLVLEQSRPPGADAPTIIELSATRPADGAQVTDPDTVRLVERLRTDGTFARLGLQPTGYFFRRDRGLTVMVANGPAAVFGDSSNYDFKVRAWEGVLAQQRQAGGRPAPAQAATPAASGARAVSAAPVAEIDLRFGRNVVLR